MLHLPIDVVETIITLLADDEDFTSFEDAIHSDSRSKIYKDLIIREYKKRLERIKKEEKKLVEMNAELLEATTGLEHMQKIFRLDDDYEKIFDDENFE